MSKYTEYLNENKNEMQFLGSIVQIKDMFKKVNGKRAIEIQLGNRKKIEAWKFDGTYYYDKDGKVIGDVDMFDGKITLLGKESIHNRSYN